MAWASNTEKVELGSVGGSTPLLVGKFDYKIKEAKEVKKAGETEAKVTIDFEREGVIYKQWFRPESDNENVSRIAVEQITKIAKAAGIKGVLKPSSLAQFAGKCVSLDAYENERNGKKYVNIGGIDVAESAEEEEEQEEGSSEAAEPKKRPWG